MRLTPEQVNNVSWNDFSVEDIDALIDLNIITEADISWYYNNTNWRDVV